jgi:steroid delta-isomerase-like uncharacterized protein
MAAGWQHPDMAVFESLHALSFHDHSAAGRPPDLEGFLQGIAALYASFPDFYAEIEDLVVDADVGKVVVRWKATGKHEREFLGAPATGKRISFMGIEILHIANGQIVERWGEWDGLHLVDQLGHTIKMEEK